MPTPPNLPAPVAKLAEDKKPAVCIKSLWLIPYPGRVFVWIPSCLVAIVCGILATLFSSNLTLMKFAGGFYAVILYLSLIVITFEFTRLVGLFVLLALAFIMLAMAYCGFLGSLIALLGNMTLISNNHVYFAWAGLCLGLFAVAWVTARFEMYEITPMQFIRHTGFWKWRDSERFPTLGLKVSKEITDIFEYMVIGTGRIVIYPSSEQRSIVIDGVLRVDRMEAELLKVIEAAEVRIEKE